MIVAVEAYGPRLPGIAAHLAGRRPVPSRMRRTPAAAAGGTAGGAKPLPVSVLPDCHNLVKARRDRTAGGGSKAIASARG
jgi:hypothetical protein